jgi:hypothetical protein
MKQGTVVSGRRSLVNQVVRVLVLAVVSIVCVTGCVDLKAVGTFARESSAIARNSSAISATFPQTVAYGYDKSYLSPNSKEFKGNEAITIAALKALDGYMTTLGQISANGVTNVDPEFAKIAAGVKSLKASNAHAQAVITEVGSLFNIVLNAKIHNDVKRLILSSAVPVDKIAMYLVDQSQITVNTYAHAISATNAHWLKLTEVTSQDARLCKNSNICKTVYALAEARWRSQLSLLTRKQAAAQAAELAFIKIGADNASLVKNVNHLGAKSVIKALEADEPDLRNAIQSARTL